MELAPVASPRMCLVRRLTLNRSSQVAVRPGDLALAALCGNGRGAVAGQIVSEELQVVETTLFHADVAQQIVLAR